MRRFILLCATLAIAGSAFAELNWKEELKSDIVKIRDGKMVMEEFNLLKIPADDGTMMSYQIRMYAEAPMDGSISRDSFVAMALTQYFPFIYILGGLGAEIQTLEAPIGKVDQEINIYMSGQGIQVESKDNNSNTTERETHTWESIFKH